MKITFETKDEASFFEGLMQSVSDAIYREEFELYEGDQELYAEFCKQINEQINISKLQKGA